MPQLPDNKDQTNGSEHLLNNKARSESIPGIKVRQPWASWILYRGKCEEIRSKRNHHRGIVAILASGWDKYFTRAAVQAQYPLPYEHYCIVALAKLTGNVSYWKPDIFAANVHRHLNPAHFYSGRCYGWVLQDITPIAPIYYVHSKNTEKSYTIHLRGNQARVRVPVAEIRDHIRPLSTEYVKV